MIKVINLLFLLFILLFPSSAKAELIPTLIDPINTYTTSDLSPKLSWNYSGICPQEGNCFLIEVAKSDNFSGPEKSTYTNNTSYSPSLTEGSWFWHVKAKDEKGTWTNFSETFRFTITNKSVPTQNPSSTPSPTQSPAPTAQPSSNNENRGATNEKIFTISSAKTNLNSNESTTIQVIIKNFAPNTAYYLKPSFFQENSTNYFGLIEINNNWIKNSTTATSQYKITTDASGNWNGIINSKIDPDDSGFKGSRNYNLKVGRYTETGSGLTWSNSQTVNITHIEEATTTSPTKPNESPTPTVKPEVLAEDTEIISNEYEEKNYNEATISAEITHQIASLSAEMTKDNPKGETIVAGDKKINWWLISSGFTLLLVSCTYIVYQRKKMYHA